MHKYRLIAKKGEGTFSEVLKAQSVKSGKHVAIKCMKNHFDSLEQVNNLREIQALRRLSPHPNIIRLIDVLYDQPTGRLALVFELMEMNCYELIRGRRHYLPEGRVKHYIYQLLRSMDHMHRNGIFHRDIKPENILLMDDELKLADFGSCRGIYSKQPYTEYISTRWYRAPECLLTDGFYNYKMDMWGVGCVFFEIMALYPLFPGTNELDQVAKIHAVLGTPSAEILAKFKKHSNAHIDFNFAHKEATPLAKLIAHASAECVDLITKLLAYNPDERMSARQALRHPLFRDIREAEKRAIALNQALAQTAGRGFDPGLVAPPLPGHEAPSGAVGGGAGGGLGGTHGGGLGGALADEASGSDCEAAETQAAGGGHNASRKSVGAHASSLPAIGAPTRVTPSGTGGGYEPGACGAQLIRSGGLGGGAVLSGSGQLGGSGSIAGGGGSSDDVAPSLPSISLGGSSVVAGGGAGSVYSGQGGGGLGGGYVPPAGTRASIGAAQGHVAMPQGTCTVANGGSSSGLGGAISRHPCVSGAHASPDAAPTAHRVAAKGPSNKAQANLKLKKNLPGGSSLRHQGIAGMGVGGPYAVGAGLAAGGLAVGGGGLGVWGGGRALPVQPSGLHVGVGMHAGAGGLGSHAHLVAGSGLRAAGGAPDSGDGGVHMLPQPLAGGHKGKKAAGAGGRAAVPGHAGGRAAGLGTKVSRQQHSHM